MQAHLNSSVVMDIAAFKVSHGVGPDCDTTALQAKGGARNIPSGRWRTCQGRFKMQTLTYCNAKITSTRTAVGQFKGQFIGAMERYTWVRFAGKLTSCQTMHIATVSIPSGHWIKFKENEGSKGKHSAP